jgi:hypothetical protein
MKVIKINLTTARNSEILHSLVQWFPNGGLGFCRLIAIDGAVMNGAKELVGV